MGTTTDRKFYSVREFCHRNSIGKTTFFALVKSGAITTLKMGARTLVSAESEKAWHETLGARSTNRSTNWSTKLARIGANRGELP